MTTRTLGTNGPRVSPLGLGCRGMSDFYGPADEAESVATLQAALTAGVTLLDTGDYYGMGHNELLLREALRDRPRDEVVLSVKFGLMRGPDGAVAGNDLRPPALRNFLAYTLRRLRSDHVDIYRPGRVFPDPPIEDTVGALAELVQAGYIRHIGLSEVGAETIRRARGIEDETLPTCRELGIASLPTASSPAACSAAIGRRSAPTPFPLRTSGPPPHVSRARISNGTSRSSTRSLRSPRRGAGRSPSWRSPGRSHGERTSSRSSEPGDVTGSRRRSARSSSSWTPMRSPGSRPPSRREPSPASGTTTRRWERERA